MTKLTHTDLTVSPLCLGTVGYGTGLEDEEAYRQMDTFFDRGGNFIDTAHVYGDWGDRGPAISEKIIGRWLTGRGNREKVVISTKGAHPDLSSMEISRMDGDSIRSDLGESLKNLQTDYIDLYFLHRDDSRVPVEEVLGILEEARIRGDIRYYGCSNWTLKRLVQAQEYALSAGLKGFVCNQLMWSLADINAEALWDKTMVLMDRDTFAYQEEKGLSAMAYTSIARGYFSRRAAGEEIGDPLTQLYKNTSNETILKYLLENIPEGYTMMDLCLLYFRVQSFEAIPIASFSSDRQLMAALDSLDKKCPGELLKAVSKMKQFT